MKTNPLTSRLRNLYLYLGKHRKMSGCAGVPACFLFTIAALLVVLLLISLVACKSPAVITNNESHRTRDSNYHASVQRIETHDTIIFGAPSIEYPSPIIRISDRKITIHDTVFIARTDTLLRTQIITQKERYIPPLYRFAP